MSQEFASQYRATLEQIADMIDEGIFEHPAPLDPFSLGVNEKTYEEMTKEELLLARGIIYEVLGIKDTDTPHDQYLPKEIPGHPLDGPIWGKIFKTNFESYYLHVLTYLGGLELWTFGPNEQI